MRISQKTIQQLKSIPPAKDLTHHLQTNLLGVCGLREEFERTPNASRYLGVVPESWTGNIPEKINATKEIFSRFAKSRNLDALIRGFKKHLGIKPEARWVGEGHFGFVFNLEIKKINYALKVYKPDAFWEYHHGPGNEIQNACFADKNGFSGRYAPFCFGKFALSEKDRDGFLVTKFVDEKNFLELQWNNKGLYRLAEYVSCPDYWRSGNTRGDTIVDFGQIHLNEKLADNKKRQFAMLILNVMDKQAGEYAQSLRNMYGDTKEFIEALKYVNASINNNADELLAVTRHERATLERITRVCNEPPTKPPFTTKSFELDFS